MKLNLKPTLVILGISLLAKAGVAQIENTNPSAMDLNSDRPVTAQHFVWEAATTDLKEIKMGELALEKSDNPDVKMFAEHMIADHKKACKKLQAIATKEGLQFPDTNSIEIAPDHSWNNGSNSNWNTEGNTNGNTNTYMTASMERGGHLATNSDGSVTTNMSAVTDINAGTNAYLTAANPRGQGDTTNALVDSTIGGLRTNYPTAGMPRGQRIDTNLDEVDMGTNRMEHPMVNLAMLSGATFDRAYAKKMVKGHEEAIRKFEAASAGLQDAGLKKYADKTLPTLRHHLEMAEELRAKVGTDSNTDMTNSPAGLDK